MQFFHAGCRYVFCHQGAYDGVNGETTMKAIVDRETCIGCGLCVQICETVFELNGDSIAVVKVNPVPAKSEATCKEAAESCPTTAIKVE
jgi:ferredoxin